MTIGSPDFFIVGAPKCGTTALYEYLREHPQVFLPEVKEPNWFAADPAAPRFRDLDHYLELFRGAAPGQRVGEATVSYLRSPVASERIREFCPTASIIACVREPLDLLRSEYRHQRAAGREPSGRFESALERSDAERQALRAPRPPAYLELPRYAPHLRRYVETFGREQVLVLLAEELRADTAAAFSRVLEHLRLPPGPAVGFRPFNEAREVRAPAATAVLRRLGVTPAQVTRSRSWRQLSSGRLAPLAERIGSLARRAYAPRASPGGFEVDPQLAREIRGRFRDDRLILSQEFGLDVARWWPE